MSLVDAVKTCGNDVKKAVKYLSESPDPISQFSGQLLDDMLKRVVESRRRRKPR